MKKKIGIFYGDKRNNGDYDNGVLMDILKIPYLTELDDARDCDIIIRTMWLESIGWSKTIRDKYPHVIQIGLSDHPLSSQISKLNAPAQIGYIKDLQYLDGILALTEEERQWYQTAIPSKPVIKFGLPFPFETYTERYGQFKNSPKKYIGLGVGAADNDRNFISNVLVFQKLRITNPTLQGVFLSVPENLIPYCTFLCDEFPNVYIQQRTNMEDYYNTLSQCKFVINLADRNTPGRLQGEAAFFGVPVIGSDRFELQTELFPEWSVTPYELLSATQMAQDILSDLSGRTVSINLTKAESRLHNYDYASSKRRFNKLLKLVEGV